MERAEEKKRDEIEQQERYENEVELDIHPGHKSRIFLRPEKCIRMIAA